MDAIKSVESGLNNKYEILNVIATGGMGAIYLAVDLKLQRKVAIKIIHKQYISDPEYRERFIREAQTVAKFDHPNIIKIFDFGCADQFDYFVMPYVEGLTYKECLVAAEHIDLKKNIAILLDVVRALEYAHGKGIIHRDLKPANFMIKSDDNQVLLMDFGTSKDLVDKDITLPDTMLGTPKYMSPEQVHLGEKDPEKGTEIIKKVHFKSDLYALGIILYEALTGKYPFSATTMISLCLCHLNEVPEPPDRVNPEIPEALNDLIMSLIAKNPDDRTKSAGEVVNRLETILKTLETPASAASESTIGGRGTPSSDSTAMTRDKKRFSWIFVGLGGAIISIMIALGGYLFWPSSHGINKTKPTREKIVEGGEQDANLSFKSSDKEIGQTGQRPKKPVPPEEIRPLPDDGTSAVKNEFAVLDTPTQTSEKADSKNVVFPKVELTGKEKEGTGVEISGLEIIKSPAITLNTSKSGYRIGEKLFINIKVLRPCFLTVFYQDVYGDLTQIYPNIYVQSQKINLLSDIRIPDISWGIDLEMVGPEGEESVIALSSDSPLDICEEDYSKQPFHAVSHGEKERLAGLMADFKKSKALNIDVQQLNFRIY